MVGGNWLKSIFFLFLDHLPGFPNYTFLNFQKKFFSLHPIRYSRKSEFTPDTTLCLIKFFGCLLTNALQRTRTRLEKNSMDIYTTAEEIRGGNFLIPANFAASHFLFDSS